MIKTQKDEYSWEIMFLASEINATQEGAKLGIGNRWSYQSSGTAKGTEAVYGLMSQNVRRMRSGRKILDDDGKTLGK